MTSDVLVNGHIFKVDCNRAEWVVVQLLRLGPVGGPRYTLSIAEDGHGGLRVTAYKTDEGESILNGVPVEVAG